MNKARMSDAAVKAKTGKNWQQWFAILNKANAKKMSHKDIAEYLYEKRGVPGWWSQMIAVTYEQECGLRDKHQMADGYAVSASRTFEVSIGKLYNHWSDDELRKQWLKEQVVIRKATLNKSMRIMWSHNTYVDVYLYEKGASESSGGAAYQAYQLSSSRAQKVAVENCIRATDRRSVIQKFVYILL